MASISHLAGIAILAVALAVPSVTGAAAERIPPLATSAHGRMAKGAGAVMAAAWVAAVAWVAVAVRCISPAFSSRGCSNASSSGC